MPDKYGHYSGVEFEFRVHANLGRGTELGTWVVTTRDDAFDTTQVAAALNETLRKVWDAGETDTDGRLIAGLAVACPERIARSHDCTYPASTERVALHENYGDGVPMLSPALPAPLLDIWRVLDRQYSTDQPDIFHVDIENFWRTDDLHWTYHAGCLYLSDAAGKRGPGTDIDIRVDWIAMPETFSLTSDQPITRIPRELHETIAIGAAWRVAEEIHDDNADRLHVRYLTALKSDMRGLRRSVHQPKFMRRTRALAWER